MLLSLRQRAETLVVSTLLPRPFRRRFRLGHRVVVAVCGNGHR